MVPRVKKRSAESFVRDPEKGAQDATEKENSPRHPGGVNAGVVSSSLLLFSLLGAPSIRESDYSTLGSSLGRQNAVL